jgi:hypothetical protein
MPGASHGQARVGARVQPEQPVAGVETTGRVVRQRMMSAIVLAANLPRGGPNTPLALR